jgi:lipopolysaccharide/colanic/teichoic acid biosynthesis glycosyltransferase
MSFVGPRALRPGERDTTAPDRTLALNEIKGFAHRQTVRPGLTGIAQVYAARDVSRRNKFRYDSLYVRRASICLDLRLILRSFWVTATASWERRGRRGRRNLSV